MRLWTWQEPEQCLTCGCVDLEQSEYCRDDPAIRDAYAELAKVVGTDQLIWCYVRDGEYSIFDCDTRLRWTLEVPDDGILRFTDDHIWNRILGKKIRIPRAINCQWEIDCPPGEADRAAYLNRREDEYYAQTPPGGSWWPQLFIDKSALRLDDKEQLSSALLRHPIPQPWVVRRPQAGCSACSPPRPTDA